MTHVLKCTSLRAVAEAGEPDDDDTDEGESPEGLVAFPHYT